MAVPFRAAWGRPDRVWSALLERPAAGKARRLGLEPLEPRLVPAGPPVFDYGIWGGALGTVVTLTNDKGSVTRVADHLSDDGVFALATFDQTPPAEGGYNVYRADVTAPAGYSLWRKYDPIWVNNPGGNYVTNATAYTNTVAPPRSAPAVTCDPGPPVPRPAAGNDNAQPLADLVSPAGVRYADGAVTHTETDLTSDGFAAPWGQTRTYTQDRLGLAFGQHNGNGWVNTGLPVFRRTGNSGSVARGGQAASQFTYDVASDTWRPAYHEKSGLSKAVPGELTLTDEGGNRFVFNDPTVQRQAAWANAPATDERLAQLPAPAAATDRTARHWYHQTALSLAVTPTDAARHRVSLYLVDFDNKGRSQTVEVLDAAGAVLDTRTVAGFGGGTWLTYDVAGPTRFRLARQAGPSAVLAGVFFDPAPATGPLFVGADTATKGGWRGVYGADGYSLPLTPTGTKPPAYATLDVSGPSPKGQEGQLRQYVDASGEVTKVTRHTPEGLPAELRRQNGSVVEAWQYAYTTAAYAAPLIRSVTLTRSADGGTTWQPVRSVEYRYHAEGTTPADQWGQLKSAVTRDGDVTGPALKTSYYRYYRTGEADGDGRSLKFVVAGAAFDRMAAAYGVNAESAGALTDEQVAAFADRAYRYDAQGRVTRAVVQGTGARCAGSTPGRASTPTSTTRTRTRPWTRTTGNDWATRTSGSAGRSRPGPTATAPPSTRPSACRPCCGSTRTWAPGWKPAGTPSSTAAAGCCWWPTRPPSPATWRPTRIWSGG